MRFPLTLLASLLLAACGDHYPRIKLLDHRFTYWQSSSDLSFIVEGDASGGIEIIPGNIDFIAKESDWVFGHITPYPQELDGLKPRNPPGVIFTLRFNIENPKRLLKPKL